MPAKPAAKGTMKVVSAMKTTKPVRTGKPVNKNEKLRAEKKMKAVGNAAAETGKNPYKKK